MKNDIIFMNLQLIYKNPITLSLLKIVTLKFTMYILAILKYSLKLHVIGKQSFDNSAFFKHQFQGTSSCQ